MNKLRRIWSTFWLVFRQGDCQLRAVEWNIHDRAQLGFFLAGEAGQKLDLVFQHEIVKCALNGDLSTARGFQKARDTINFIKISAAVPTDSNSRAVDAQSTTATTDGETVLRDRYSP